MKFKVRALFLVSMLCLSVFTASAQTEEENPQIAKKLEDALNRLRKNEKKSSDESDKEESKDNSSSSSILSRVGANPSQISSLSLNEAIRKALENNNNIEVARDDVRIAETQLRSLIGTYDPVFTVTPTYNNNVQPQPTTLGGADLSGVTRTNSFSVNSSFDQLIRATGGSYSAFFNNNRQETNSLFAQLNPNYTTNLGIQYTQPIFRNRAIDNTRRQIKIQRKRLEQSDADFRRQTIGIISQVQAAYWDLVFALRDQQNRAANLNLAKENLRQVEASIAAGRAAPLERAEVSTELANRESDVLVAAQQVSIAENSLKNLLLKETTDPDWNQSIVPTDQPIFSQDSLNLDIAIKDAIDNRPELRRLKLEREVNSINLEFFKNQTRPRVDLNTSYGLIGLAGSVNSGVGTVPPQFNGGYFRSLNNLFHFDTRQFSVGATIQIPLRNRTAKADLAGAEIQKHQIEAQTRSQEQTIIVEVRNAVQAVETSRQRVLAARRARENAEIQLNGERKLYEAGRSTTFLLFQRENALANARNAEIRAETDFNKALADLQRATSTTFQTNNIEIESPVKDK